MAVTPEVVGTLPLRFERKYRIEDVDLNIVRQSIRMHPAGFRLLYPDRVVNNVYFDYPDFSGYKLNLMGIGLRRKHRLRWYGADLTDLSKVQLEIKQRENELGSKQVVKLEKVDWQEVPRIFEKHLPEKPCLRPALINSYLRTYWGARNGKFRITLDRQQTFLPLMSRQLPAKEWLAAARFPQRDPAYILEVKYNEEFDQEAQEILQSIPFRQSRNSKYINGLSKGW
jgi:hypothetical protein